MADRSITIKFLGDSSSLSKASHDAEVSVSGFDSALGSVAKTAAGFVVGAAITKAPGYLMDAAKAAAEDSANMEKLKTAVTNASGSYDGYSDAIQQAISDGQKKAFTDDQTRDALTTLINETGSTEEAMKRLGAAQDLARGTGMDLATAAKVLGKVSDENTSVLARYGIQVDKNATAQDVLNTVDAKFGGQAASFAATDAAKMQIMADKVSELQEQLGYYLLPVLSLIVTAGLAVVDVFATQIVPAIGAAMAVISPFTDLIANNLMPIFVALSPLLAGAAVVIAGALVSAFVSWAAATWAQVAAALALNASMLPWIALLAAIGVAVGVLYLAWQSNFLGIQDITASFLGWMQTNVLPVLDAVWAAVQTGLAALQTAWNTVFPAIQAVVETVMPIISAVVTTYIAALRLEIETGINAAKAVFDIVFPLIQSVVETVMPIIASVVTTYIGILRTEIEAGVAAAKFAFDNVFVPIQGVVSDVFTTIAGLVTTLYDPAITAIEAGVTAAKTAYDETFVPIQGIVEDVFNTISGFVDTLWAGESGAVGKIKSGLADAEAAFSGVYDTFYDFGSKLVGGLIDGIVSLYHTLEDWIGKIAKLLIIDVPDHSPPYEAGYEQGAAFVGGLSDGIAVGFPGVTQATMQAGAIIAGGADAVNSYLFKKYGVGLHDYLFGNYGAGAPAGGTGGMGSGGGTAGSPSGGFGPMPGGTAGSPSGGFGPMPGGTAGSPSGGFGAGGSPAQAFWVRIHPDDLRQLTGEGF